MSDSLHELILAAIKKTLPIVEECHSDPLVVASFITVKFQQISNQLEPMIGTNGVEALFNRSLYLASSENHRLFMTDKEFGKEKLMAYFSLYLAEFTPNEAINASFNILVTFTELLISLIGISLTQRLLATVWEETPTLLLQDHHHD